MQVTTLFEGEALSVYSYRCNGGPADRPFVEVHGRHSLSYVRRGSFGCRTLGAEHELVAGAVMVGRPLLWGLSVGGAAGARRVLELMLAEFDSAIALVGCPLAEQLDRSFVCAAPWAASPR